MPRSVKTRESFSFAHPCNIVAAGDKYNASQYGVRTGHSFRQLGVYFINFMKSVYEVYEVYGSNFWDMVHGSCKLENQHQIDLEPS